MMTLITGTPGSGKTLYAVSRIIEESKKGRLIFSDIEGLNVPGVHPMPDNLDWRDTPDGSLIVYDEAQQHEIFKNLGKGNSREPIVNTMEVHRHTGHDLIFITQHPRLISSHIRSLIGEHINVHRPYGAPIASAYRWAVCEENPNTKTAHGRAEANFKLPFKKEWFKFYKSATVHTHKLRIPENIRNMLIFIMIIAVAVYYGFSHSALFSKTKQGLETGGKIGITDKKTPNNSTNNVTHNDTNNTQNTLTANVNIDNESKRIAFVISSGAECRARNSYGELLAIPAVQCFAFANDPRLFSSRRKTDNQNYKNNDNNSNSNAVQSSQNPTNLAVPVNTEALNDSTTVRSI